MKHRFVMLLALASFGCHEAYSNENLLYLKAIPRDLEVDVPRNGGGGQGLRAAQFEEGQARFYANVLDGTREVNDMLREVFRHLDNVVDSTEPVAEEDNVRIWGPIPTDDSEVALIISRITTTTVAAFIRDNPPVTTDDWYTYALLARPKGGTDDDWVPALAGISVPNEETELGTGALFMNLAVLDSKQSGVLAVPYDTRFDRHAIDVYFDVTPMAMKFEPETGWQFRREPNGDTNYLLFLAQDIEDTGPALETFIIWARWRADWYGRADVLVGEGDLPDNVWFYASECWDPGFLRTYFETNVPEFMDQNVGTPQNCAEGLRERRLPENRFGD